MRAVSLFSGAGGFELGFQRAGIETVLQAENDPVCLSVLERHWPETARLHDVRQVDAASLRGRRGNLERIRRGADAEPLRAERPTGDARIGVIFGGFPCQDVSVAGKRAGLSGDRSSLWFEFERVLSQLRPRWVVVENVPGLFSSNAGRDFARVLMGLGELGYGWAYRVLDARWFGVPQRRRRIFVVGCLGNAPRAAQVLAVCESCGGHPQASGEAGERVAASLTGGAHGPGTNLPGRHHEDDDNLVIGLADETGYRSLVARESGYRSDWETENFVVASAVRASDGHHGWSGGRGDGADNLVVADPISAHEGKTYSHEGTNNFRLHNVVPVENVAPVENHPLGVRRLTPLECERLMGWPDEWTRYAADGRQIADSHRYRMCGNGVVATVAEWIGHRVVATDALIHPLVP